MPYEFSETTLAGRPVLKIIGTGKLVAEDATGYLSRTSPGGRNDNWPQLVVMTAGSEVTADARKVFASGQTAPSPDSLVVIVVANVVMRVTVQFLTRVTGGPGTVKVFKTEDEAIAWLQRELVVRAPR